MVSKAASKREQRAEASRRAIWLERENRRIAVQRGLFAALDACPAKDRLLVKMRERVVWLLDNCRTEEADAILEFMPDDEAGAPLDEYFEL